MNFLLLNLISILLLNVGLNVKCEKLLDPSVEEDHIFLWKKLFIELNTILSDNERLNRNVLDINKKLDDISKRLEDVSHRLDSHEADVLSKNIQNISEEEGKRHDDQQNSRSQVINDVQTLRKSQETQEKDIRDIVENIQKIIYNKKLSEPWTTVQRRKDGGINFYRNWKDYKIGFGDPDADFFIGLERLHQLTTNHGPKELLIVLTDFDNQSRYAIYDEFRIGNETENYAIIELGEYWGDAGDGLRYHKGHPFSTYDRNNKFGEKINCPEDLRGAWWFYDACFSVHLNGPYRQKDLAPLTYGVSWNSWGGWNRSLKYAAMMIRPKL